MLQTLTKGYITKSKKLRKNKSITEKIAQYQGELTINKKKIVVEVYTDEDNLKDKQIFIKISKAVTDDIYGVL